ncbi:peroxiredoxin [Pseudomonas sp.]|uniref:peroxiredoxin n=1 Tax=Pseudomonas sp. TaxID=306 RepID=UPI00272B9303|nr:peroxiredoxin [Pseudomonas sp.]
MTFLVTKEAPDFTARAVMPDNSFAELTLSSYRGKYVVLFFYPLDFTFVCPTEIIAFDTALKKFEAKNCQVVGVSVDSQFTHLAWKNTPRSQGGIGQINYPLVADLNKSISRDYGVLLDEGVALRGLFLIDKEGIIRHALVNDLPLGRSVYEAFRMVNALQFTKEFGEVCPANWQEGEEAMKPTAEGVAEYLAKHAQ